MNAEPAPAEVQKVIQDIVKSHREWGGWMRWCSIVQTRTFSNFILVVINAYSRRPREVEKHQIFAHKGRGKGSYSKPGKFQKNLSRQYNTYK